MRFEADKLSLSMAVSAAFASKANSCIQEATNMLL
jgi:hypothetical protein